MNYIKQLNAFHFKIDLEPISTNARVLWSTLMDINNRLCWREEFTVAVSKLIDKSGLTENTFRRARTELEEQGYITVTSRSGNQSAMYKIVRLYTEVIDNPDEKEGAGKGRRISGNVTDKVAYIEDVDSGHEAKNADNISHKLTDKSTPLIKHKTKQKQNHKQNKTNPTTDAMTFFQENFGFISPFVAQEIIYWSNDLGENLVMNAMKRALERNKANWGYVKGILQAWVKKGIKSVEGAKAEEQGFQWKQYQQKKERATVKTKQQVANIVPDWYYQQKSKEQEKREQSQCEAEQRNLVAEQEEIARLLAEL